MPTSAIPDFERLIAGIARALGARKVPFMLIGGQAVLLHGEPRLTRDIDVTLGVDPGSLDTILNASQALGLQPLLEDLILHKLFAGRPRDLEDAAGVLRRQGQRLDWPYLEQWAREFALVPGREGLPGQLQELRTEMDEGR